MPNIEHVMTSLKCSWIKRLFLNSTKWTRLFKATSGLRTNKLINDGRYCIIQQRENIVNQFYLAGCWYSKNKMFKTQKI